MGEAPVSLLTTRAHMAAITGSPLGDIGIAPDASHLSSGGYHCGALDLRSINAVGNDDYSIRQTRDRNQYNADVATGTNFASAMDYPDDWPIGGRAAWVRFNNILRAQLGARDPMLRAIRGINYTPDGTTKRRFDCRTLVESSTTDTVLWHTHIEWWRDTIGDVQARDDATTRLCQIARAAIGNVSLSTITAQDSAPPPGGKSMQFWTVTGVPAGATDIYGASLGNNSRICPTPQGIFCYQYGEIIEPFNDAPHQTITLTYPRAVQLAQAWMPKPLNVTELAQQIAAAYPVDQIDQQTILSALTSEAGHAAFVELLSQDAVKAILADEAMQGIKNL